MSIKQLCFDAHTRLRDQHEIAVRRTHLYELLAALLGFNSHAALAAEAVIGQVRQARKFNSDDQSRLSKRCLALGYPSAESQCIAEAITALAETHRTTKRCQTNLASTKPPIGKTRRTSLSNRTC